jgi:AraC-like DNA-binding protein
MTISERECRRSADFEMDEADCEMNIYDRMTTGIPHGFFSSQVFRARLFQREAGKGTLSVVCGGCEHCAADYRIDRTTFPYWCLEFVAAGRGTVRIGRRSETLGPGSFFIYGPRIAYRMESDARHPLVKYFVDLAGRRARPLLRELGFSLGATGQVFPPGEIAEAFDRLIDAGLSASALAGRQTALLLESLLVRCAERRLPGGGAHAATRAFATYRRCRDVIDARGLVLRGVAQAAEACHVDPAYLSRLFRRFAGCGPHDYLARRRMEAATQRLAEPGRLVKEVADEFAFADAYHFSRAFKRFHGVPPGEFQRRRR